MVPPVFVLLRLCTTVVQDGSPKKVVWGLAHMKRKNLRPETKVVGTTFGILLIVSESVLGIPEPFNGYRCFFHHKCRKNHFIQANRFFFRTANSSWPELSFPYCAKAGLPADRSSGLTPSRFPSGFCLPSRITVTSSYRIHTCFPFHRITEIFCHPTPYAFLCGRYSVIFTVIFLTE